MKKAVSLFFTAIMLFSLFTVLACPVSAYSTVRPSEGDYYICASADNGHCLDITGGSTAMQTLAQLWERSDNNAAQIFTLKRYSGDYYKIYHKASGYILNVQSGVYSNGTRIWLWSSDDSTNASLWRFLDCGDGNYILQNRSGYVLDLDNNLVFSGSRVHIWSYHEGQSARWRLVSASGGNTVYGTVNTASANLILRASPSTSAARITSMPKGSQVTLLSTAATNGFYNIRYGSRTGWASAAYIKINSNDDDAATSAWEMPMKNAYCTWRSYSNMSWGSYTKNSSGRNYHLGIDIYGTGGAVYAAASGKVAALSTSASGANGRYVIIEHTLGGKTVYSFYAHLSSVSVSKGQTVSVGDRIGTAGGSGYGRNSYYGTHLHFAIVDRLWSGGDYYGYSTYFTGNKRTYRGVTYYNPVYVVNYDKLP